MKKNILSLILILACFCIQSQTGVVKPAWELLGSTTNSNNFLGTKNAQPLVFKTNNVYRGKIESSGKVYFGSDSIVNSGLGIMRIRDLATSLDLGTISTNLAGIWGVKTTPSTTNYGISFGITNTNMNASSLVSLQIGAAQKLTVQTSAVTIQSGVNFNVTDNLFSPTIYGSSASGGSLSLFSTSNATKGLIQIGNTGTINIGNASVNPTSLGLVRIGQGTSWADFGERSSGIFGMWFGQTTPNTSNYGLIGTSSVTRLNGNAVSLQVATVDILACNSSGAVITGSASASGAFSANSLNSSNAINGVNIFASGELQGNTIRPVTATNLIITTRPTVSNDIVFNCTGTTPNETMRLTSAGNTSITGNFILNNNQSIQQKSADGTLRTLIQMTSGDNININGKPGTTDISLNPTVAGLGLIVKGSNGSVGFGVATPNASARVDITSTTQGFLPPRMTATQGSAISSPAEGLMIYVTDTNGTFTAKGWWGYDGAAWQKLNN